MSSLAPIVLFTYNRPSQTKILLDSLAANAESKHSCLYIYCDGPKKYANEETIQKILSTRKIVKKENRFKETFVIEKANNRGLAFSIIEGVTDVINKHGRVIVLEDDLILSNYFLYYMNDSLKRYEDNLKIGQIGACNFFACGKRYPNSFFIPIPDCLGWATWQNRWVHFNSDAQQLLQKLIENDLIFKFNGYGSYDMKSMLIDQIKGKGTSWAVRWTAVSIINNWLTLYPNPSMTNHIQSQEATNTNVNIIPPLCSSIPNLETVEVVELPEIIKAMKRGLRGISNYYGYIKKQYYIKIIRNKILLFIPSFIIDFLKTIS